MFHNDWLKYNVLAFILFCVISEKITLTFYRIFPLSSLIINIKGMHFCLVIQNIIKLVMIYYVFCLPSIILPNIRYIYVRYSTVWYIKHLRSLPMPQSRPPPLDHYYKVDKNLKMLSVFFTMSFNFAEVVLHSFYTHFSKFMYQF